MLVNDDPVFKVIHSDFTARQDGRIAWLRENYDIKGHNQLGGDIRPEMNLCNMDNHNMFDGGPPKIGDVIALGFLYGDRPDPVLICRIAERYPSGQRPECPRCPGYRFEWRVEPIAWHDFIAPIRDRDAARRVETEGLQRPTAPASPDP